MPSHKYKLTYFDIRARGELTRLVFAVAGAKYEDHRIQNEEWSTLKQKVPLGMLPVLEVDGKQIGQSMTIARFLAREYGLMGKTNMEQAQIDQILETACGDLRVELLKVMFEKDETKKVEMMKKFKEEISLNFLRILENLLKSNKGGDKFFVGNNLTLADLAVFDGLYDILERQLVSLELYPKLEAHRQRIQSVPRIAEWIKIRPKSQF